MGSTGSYLYHKLAEQLRLPYQQMEAVTITLAAGKTVTSMALTPQAKWTIQGYIAFILI